jgi:hypothetical protein
MSGAEIEETVRRALEVRVRLHDGADALGLITEDEVLDAAGAFEWNKPGRAQRGPTRWWGT